MGLAERRGRFHGEKGRAAAVATQRAYYEATAAAYDEMHADKIEHDLALAFMGSAIGMLGVRSVLDVGSGTGKVPLYLKSTMPPVRAIGLEPSPALREQGYGKGLTPDELVDGDAQALPFANGTFDLVCAFAALHHIPDPQKAVSEMLRVGSTAIFISDCNNFGTGRWWVKAVKQAINATRLYPAAVRLRTGGKCYAISEDDGLHYSYSVFNNYRQLSAACSRVHMLNTRPSGVNLYRSASHVALLGIK